MKALKEMMTATGIMTAIIAAQILLSFAVSYQVGGTFGKVAVAALLYFCLIRFIQAVRMTKCGKSQ